MRFKLVHHIILFLCGLLIRNCFDVKNVLLIIIIIIIVSVIKKTAYEALLISKVA